MINRQDVIDLAQAYPHDLGYIKELIHPRDEGKDFIVNGNTYRWYAALAALMAQEHPTCPIIEIGVRYGYSIGTMVAAASEARLAQGKPVPITALAIDNEQYITGSVRHWQRWMRANYPGTGYPHMHKRPHKLEFEAWICSVDGDHSYEGTLDDLAWAWVHTAPGGVIVVDDMNHKDVPGVRKAVESFIHAVKPEWYEIPSWRGTALIWRSV
ncbi:MAG: class I SAM-dependent methyltransferase [Thiothrix sp.]|uniref:class I SAM-dependent methyltransferase n=1 Tax=Thiothrix sp. TaxID=1032 RepID=UPI00262FFE35|nr:class I SAM-dependent methyltransferase [Thiothrix sp.]MDD5395177.1 class I SAM-dependent methyltransferase [Thiothrix sp.]